jgi:hypothetical protein
MRFGSKTYKPSPAKTYRCPLFQAVAVSERKITTAIDVAKRGTIPVPFILQGLCDEFGNKKQLWPYWSRRGSSAL